MKRSYLVIQILLFSISISIDAAAGSLQLRFVDLSGNPIPDVAVEFSYTATPPATPGSGVVRSDANGNATLNHPCGASSGSCCVLTSALAYTVSKPGFHFAVSSGTVSCGSLDSSLTIIGTDLPEIVSVSAANYQPPLSTDMLASVFGVNLSAATVSASMPLPTLLGSRQVMIKDAQGTEHAAPLLFVSPSQINLLIPPGVGSGMGSVILKDEGGALLAADFIEVRNIAPGIFTANQDGAGVPAALIVRVQPGNVQTIEPVYRFDEATARFVAREIDLGPETDSVFLVLFGTGWREVRSTADVQVRVGELEAAVHYAGAQPTIAGLDQINALLPRSLIGKGEVFVEVVVAGRMANRVLLRIE